MKLLGSTMAIIKVGIMASFSPVNFAHRTTMFQLPFVVLYMTVLARGLDKILYFPWTTKCKTIIRLNTLAVYCGVCT